MTASLAPARLVRPLLALVAVLLGLAAPLVRAATPAAPAAMITILDGDATVLEGNQPLLAAEGQTVNDEAIVRTGPKTTLLRLEWPDGTTVDLGPDTSAMVEPAGFGQRGGRPPALYLMRGWAKISAPASATHPGLLAPHLDVPPVKGTALVVMQSDAEQWLFAETGRAAVVERDARPANTLALRGGAVYVRLGEGRGTVSARPTPAQMQRVPRGFRDTLPLRLAQVKDRKVTPRPAAEPTYADLAEWLDGERPLRRNFVRRFTPRTRDAAFRAELARHLSSHPEWERTLFPERFVKPASAPR